MKFWKCWNLGVIVFYFVLLDNCTSFSVKDYIPEVPEICLLSSCFERRLCDSIVLDLAGLKHDLNAKLYGQHIVIPTVLKSIKGHLCYPEKALVLSFHGSTGIGKNYVVQMIKENMFKGEAKKHFHYFNPELHFKHKRKVSKYKEQLQSWILHNVSNCQNSMFVFDEMENMPPGLIDALTPFLGHNPEVNGVDFRKTIFIFLSDVGGHFISEMAFEHWEDGGKRESLKLADVQQVLELSTFNMENGLEGSRVVKKSLVDHYIPFLPLERKHVRRCIEDFLERKDFSLNEDMINEVLDELGWFPNGIDLFSKTGCKKIMQLVFTKL